MLFNIDFMITWSNPTFDFLEKISSMPKDEVVAAYFTYTLIFVGGAAGICTALYVSPAQADNPQLTIFLPRSSRSANATFSLILVFYLLVRISTPASDNDVSYTLA